MQDYGPNGNGSWDWTHIVLFQRTIQFEMLRAWFLETFNDDPWLYSCPNDEFKWDGHNGWRFKDPKIATDFALRFA